jgi:hypothetical protein
VLFFSTRILDSFFWESATTSPALLISFHRGRRHTKGLIEFLGELSCSSWEEKASRLVTRTSPFAYQIPALKTCDGSYSVVCRLKEVFLHSLAEEKTGNVVLHLALPKFLDDGIEGHPCKIFSKTVLAMSFDTSCAE